LVGKRKTTSDQVAKEPVRADIDGEKSVRTVLGERRKPRGKKGRCEKVDTIIIKKGKSATQSRQSGRVGERLGREVQ